MQRKQMPPACPALSFFPPKKRFYLVDISGIGVFL